MRPTPVVHEGHNLLSVLAGIALYTMSVVQPAVGHGFTVKAFIVTVLAGVGSIPGVFLGAILLGAALAAWTRWRGPVASRAGRLALEIRAPSLIAGLRPGHALHLVRPESGGYRVRRVAPVSRIDLLRDTNLIGVYADDVFVTVVIEERQIIAGTHRIMLMFGAKDYQLRQWTVTDPQGYDTTVAVYNLDSTRRPDPTMFRIDYTRVIQ